MRRLTALLALIAPASVAHAALPVDQCTVLEREGQTAEVGHRDEGDGVVSYLIVSDGMIEVTQLFVLDCQSGDAVSATLSMVKTSPGRRGAIMDHRNEVLDYFDGLRASGDRVTPETAMSRLTEVGAKAVRTTSGQERCACAALYPDMRGSKKPYEASE